MTATYYAGTDTYRDSTGTYRAGYGGDRHYVDQPIRLASDAQVRYLSDLFAHMAQVRPEVFEQHFDRFQRTAGIPGEWNDGEPATRTMTAAVASKAIDWAIKIAGPLPKKASPARLDFRSIPDGNYAIGTDEPGDPIKFYRVTTNGRWKNVQIRASMVLHSVKGRAGIAILHKIVEAGLEESQMLFATKLEKCWKCGLPLTNDVSRARGTGDDCAAK